MDYKIVDKMMEDILKEVVRSFHKPSPLFGEFAMYVLLLKQKEDKIAESTYERYVQLMNRIEPIIGEIPLDTLTPEHLKELYAKLGRKNEAIVAAKARALPSLYQLKEERNLSNAEISRVSGVPVTTVSAIFRGKTVLSQNAVAVAHALGKKEPELFSVTYGCATLAEKTILEHYRFVYMVLEYAVRERYVPKNVAKDCAPASAAKKEKKTLTAEELDRFYLALETEPLKWRLVMRMLIETGCVRGEIIALLWDRVDLENRKIRVTHRMARNAGSGYHVEPVKEGKERTVLISESLVQMLKEYRTEQEKVQRVDEKGYVFTQRDGSVMYPDSVTGRLSKISEKCGIPSVNAEMLRKVLK